MPKLTGKNSVGKLFQKVEEGVVLTKKEQEAYDSITFDTEQLRAFSADLSHVIQTYRRVGEAVSESLRSVFKTQEIFATQIKTIVDTLSVFERVKVTFEIPRLFIPQPLMPLVFSDTQAIRPRPLPLRMRVETETPKYLPSRPIRKHSISTSAITMQNDGFLINNTPLKRFGRSSQTGIMFELLLTKGIVSDAEISSKARINDDRALSYIKRDLRNMLLDSNLEIDIKRDRLTKSYEMIDIKQRIRKPKSRKRIVQKEKTT